MCEWTKRFKWIEIDANQREEKVVADIVDQLSTAL